MLEMNLILIVIPTSWLQIMAHVLRLPLQTTNVSWYKLRRYAAPYFLNFYPIWQADTTTMTCSTAYITQLIVNITDF